jgi:hypothetical protein
VVNPLYLAPDPGTVIDLAPEAGPEADWTAAFRASNNRTMKLAPARSLYDHARASRVRNPPGLHTYIIYPRVTG